ncbi:SDR family oxidoreductase [Actinomycetota bacterium Odt1-20B]
MSHGNPEPQPPRHRRAFRARGREGATVVMSDVVDASAEAAELGAHFVAADVSDKEQVKALIAHTAATFGGPDVLVNNASELGLAGDAGVAAYCASKGGVIQLTKATAIDGGRPAPAEPGDHYAENHGFRGPFRCTASAAAQAR